MPVYVALLRAINVGGHRRVVMAELRAFLAELELEDPRTLLQSGNVVFKSPSRSSANLERLLETEAEKGLGLRTEFVIRSAREWKQIVAENPFRDEAKRDPSHLLVTLFKKTPAQKNLKALQASIRGRERVLTRRKQAYIIYPDGIGRSRLTSARIEKTLGTGTGRSWNTVLKLAALVDEL
jgi:uncharacterized protein (DUF1697 family)